MKRIRQSKNLIFWFLLLSVLGHIVSLYALMRYDVFEFTRPIEPAETIAIDLPSKHSSSVGEISDADKVLEETPKRINKLNFPSDVLCDNASRFPMPFGSLQSALTKIDDVKQKIIEPVQPSAIHASQPDDALPASPRSSQPFIFPPKRKAGDFLNANAEKLSYLITMYGVPVGNAVLEASNNNGELRIVSRARSNDAFSLIYLVDNMTETRMINGNYIMTIIRRNEGGLKSDTGFTLMLPEKKVFWIDRIRKRFKEYPVQDAEVLDIITGIYFIRNQPLEVGRNVVLKLFDSNVYAQTQIEVIRRETVVLEGRRQVATLVIHPVLKTDGFFRRSGEVMVWLTDDEFKVPVRLETTIPLGPISVELVSAEVEPAKK